MDDRNAPATKGDLLDLRDSLGTELRTEMHGIRDELRSEMHDIRDELRTEMHGMRDELRCEIRGVRDELKDEIHGLGARFERLEGHMQALGEGQRNMMETLLRLRDADREETNARFVVLETTVREHSVAIAQLERSASSDRERGGRDE